LKQQLAAGIHHDRLSLPVRECGLKQQLAAGIHHDRLSLPVRECGLKLLQYLKIADVDESLPVRECGLKLFASDPGASPCVVTPRAGVWIETLMLSHSMMKRARHSPCGSVD